MLITYLAFLSPLNFFEDASGSRNFPADHYCLKPPFDLERKLGDFPKKARIGAHTSGLFDFDRPAVKTSRHLCPTRIFLPEGHVYF